MMPLAPQLSVPHIGQISTSANIRSTMKASKPKLSFSIDSIVGKRKSYETSKDENEAELLEKSIKRHLSENLLASQNERKSSSPSSAGHNSPDLSQHRQSVSPLSNGSYSVASNPATHHPCDNSSPVRNISPLSLVTNNTQSPTSLPNIPAQFLNRSSLGLSTSHNSISPIPQPNPGQMPQVAPIGHPNHPMMVAAAAAAAAASSAHQFPSLPSDYQQAAAFYPWFLRANPFAGRFPGMPFDSPLGSFLLPPFRKPKRIRTAFSPGQLLKLEQAFEKNHYVVGNERKQLANHLGLSETQVKVWFQNRRTKHKRQKQEDEESGTGSINNGENGNANKDYSDDEEEEIDLEDEECVSDQEHDNQALKFANMHHLWYQSMSAGLMGDNPPVTSASSN